MIVALLAAQVSLQAMLQHVLAKHSHIPWPVAIQVETESPTEKDWLATHAKMPDDYVPPIAWVQRTEMSSFLIGYRASQMSMPFRPKLWVVMHEVCHIVHDYDMLQRWDTLTPEERKRREERADECASTMLRFHEERACR